MTQTLVDYLANCSTISDIKPVSVTIKKVQFSGAWYRDSVFDNEPRLYLLGELPACYRRSGKTAFVIDGEDWYVACYMQENPAPKGFEQYHPCGIHFMLCKWQTPNGDAIDKWERNPYIRVPTLLEVDTQ